MSTIPNNDIDDRLRSHSPAPSRPLGAAFTQHITKHLIANPQQHGLRRYIEGLIGRIARQLHMSQRVATVALAIAIPTSIGGAAYATYEWVKPSATITHITPSNEAGNRQLSVTALCGEFMAGTFEFELLPHSTIGDDDARRVFSNTCTYDAIQKFINATWQSANTTSQINAQKVGELIAIYDSGNIGIGDAAANPAFGLTTGKITSIDATQITISAPVYTTSSLQDGPAILDTPTTVSKTTNLLPNYQTWQDGTRIDPSALSIGDTVQLVNQTLHKVQYYDDIKQNALGEQVSFGTIAIIKAPIELAYVMFEPFGNPMYMQSLVSLDQCYNNPGYICPHPLSSALGPVYDAFNSTDPSGQPTNKYLRTDVSGKSYSLSGRITAISSSTITLQTRGKANTITIQLPYDVVTAYGKRVADPAAKDNAQQSLLPLAVGDQLSVEYMQADGDDRTQIKSGDILSLFLVEYRKDNSFYKY